MKILKQLSRFTVFQIILYPIALGFVWYFADVLGFPALYVMAAWGAIGAVTRFIVNKWMVFKEEK